MYNNTKLCIYSIQYLIIIYKLPSEENRLATLLSTEVMLHFFKMNMYSTVIVSADLAIVFIWEQLVCQ